MAEARTIEQAAEFITPEMLDKLDSAIMEYKGTPGSLIPLLQRAQEICGYLPAEIQRRVAEGLETSPSMVYGVVSFYSFFTMKPRGKHVVRVCLGTACYVKRSDEIMQNLSKELKIAVGEVTGDKKFSLEGVRCLGACGLAPVAVVGEDTYGLLDPVTATDILKNY
ncbi:MAG: NAD(P)H-dependent oxidoreductase subunit E [Proteobacteria bacterium]|nr:NAD(P)H-dependent oxidoreductase subunit E [Pseudomonadota bacterium]